MLDLLYNNFAISMAAEQVKNNIKKFQRLEPVLQYSNDHYNEQITLSQISEYACLQPEYFCHFFRKNVGVTYFRYLNEIRLAHVYHDLTETDYTLQQLLEMQRFHELQAVSRYVLREVSHDAGTVPTGLCR